MKPILFNTEMVRAIQENRKTVTRRVIKYSCPAKPESTLDDFIGAGDPQLLVGCAPYHPGDILYVRETWNHYKKRVGKGDACHIEGFYGYRAAPACSETYSEKWHPSIHMPKEAARLFLQVTGVRVERLRAMVLADVLMEGIREANIYEETWNRWHNTWNSTIKSADLPLCGWAANPWVWVIKFERISKEAALGGGGDG